MLIESDLLLPLIKKGDRLGAVSEKVLGDIKAGRARRCVKDGRHNWIPVF
jgi:hypothetical protein